MSLLEKALTVPQKDRVLVPAPTDDQIEVALAFIDGRLSVKQTSEVLFKGIRKQMSQTELACWRILKYAIRGGRVSFTHKKINIFE